MERLLSSFIETVWDYYSTHRRDMPWRIPEADGVFDPYKIFISEMMLQQTQVSRVIPKYQQFVALFPTRSSLADASLQDVLKSWSGLGYNRRAKYLHEFAKHTKHSQFPKTVTELTEHKGIGKNTAAAVLVYSCNEPLIFIETNIRSVFIHHFFTDSNEISDGEILEFVRKTLDTENPREWYWALMDYGAYLKKQGLVSNQKSRHYSKQSTFEGSDRQIRGRIIQLLTQTDGPIARDILLETIPDSRAEMILYKLAQEGLLKISKHGVSLYVELMLK